MYLETRLYISYIYMYTVRYEYHHPCTRIAATATGWTGGWGRSGGRRRTASGVPFAYRGNLRKTEWLADILVCGEYAACTRRAAGRTAGNAHIILSLPKGTSRRRRSYPKLPLPYPITTPHVFPYYILYTYTYAYAYITRYCCYLACGMAFVYRLNARRRRTRLRGRAPASLHFKNYSREHFFPEHRRRPTTPPPQNDPPQLTPSQFLSRLAVTSCKRSVLSTRARFSLLTTTTTTI